MADLTQRVLDAIGETEQGAVLVHHCDCQTTEWSEGLNACDCSHPDDVRRRCAADRDLVELCLAVRHGGDENAQDWMAHVIPLLAKGYGITEEDTQHG